MNRKNFIILGILIFLGLLSWFSILDKQAYALNVESLKETSAAFVIFKSIDATISAAEAIPFIGNILGPYNEFIERMSFVMLISLMSLGLQKVIIVSMQSFVISAILSIGVVFLIFNNLNKILSDEIYNKLFKLVVILFLIRFCIPLMTFSIASIESGTKKAQEDFSKERIEKLQTEIMNINDLLNDKEQLKAKRINSINLYKSKIDVLENKKNQISSEINNIKYKGENFVERTTSRFKGLDEESKELVLKKEKKIISIKKEIKELEAEIAKLEDEDSIFSFMQGIKGKIKIAILNLNNMMTEMFDIFLSWTILFFFRNVFFPILFIWGLFKIIDNLFKTNYISKIDIK